MATQRNTNDSNTVVTILFAAVVVALIVIGGYYLLNQPDERGVGERMDNAAETLREGGGVDDAARQLEDRTPAEKIGDAVDDAGRDVNNAVQN